MYKLLSAGVLCALLVGPVTARRREIAITEGEFGDLDLAKVDDATLIKAFKARMQIFYLMLSLASPDSNESYQKRPNCRPAKLSH